MDKIRFLEIVTDKDENDYVKATITYEDGSTEEITDKGDIVDTIIDFVAQEKAEYNDLIHDTSKVRFTPMVRTNPAPTNPEPIPQDENESGLGPIAPKKGGKAKKVAKVGGIVVVVGLALYGGYEGLKAIFKNGYSVNTGKPSIAIEGSVVNSVDQDKVQETKVQEQETQANNGYYTVNRRNDPGEDNGSKYQQNLEQSHAQGDMTDKIKSISYNKYMSHNEFLRNLSRLNLDLAMNVNDVYNLLKGAGIHGDEYLLYLETVFQQGTIEYDAVKHFCGLRNNLVHNAFVSKNPSVASELVTKFYNVFFNFVFNGYNLSPSNDFTFASLQPAAKYMIVELGKEILGLPVDFSIKYLDGSSWDKDTIRTEIELLYDTVVKLLNGQISLDGKSLNNSDFDVLARSQFDSAKSRSRG